MSSEEVPPIPDSAVVATAEMILSERFDATVRLVNAVSLNRPTVFRFEVHSTLKDAPQTVVVKYPRHHDGHPYDPDSAEWNPSWGLLADWAGLEFLTSLSSGRVHAPRFYGGDRASGVLISEDLGSGESMVESLLGNDPAAAERAMILHARALGAMHADTIGQKDGFDAICNRLGFRPRSWVDRSDSEAEITARLTELEEGLQKIDIQLSPGAKDELGGAFETFRNPGPYLAYCHIDPCPDNCRLEADRLVFFDFEASSFQHALADAAYARFLFPTCWCVNRLPDNILPLVEREYRAQLTPACPLAADDDAFYREMLNICAFWLIGSGTWLLNRALEKDQKWGISTWRQRVVTRLERFTASCEQYGKLPALEDSARRTAARLREIWPPEESDMPLYPAFRVQDQDK